MLKFAKWFDKLPMHVKIAAVYLFFVSIIGFIALCFFSIKIAIVIILTVITITAIGILLPYTF
jgi:hypothetical protein